MITLSALLVPFMVLLCWSVVMLSMQDKTESQKKLTTMLVIAAAYFYVDAFYLIPAASQSDYTALVFLDILSQFITMALPISVISFIMTFRMTKPNKLVAFVMYSPSLILGTAALMIYSLMGVNEAATFLEKMDEIGGGLPLGYDAPIYKLHEAICQKTYNIVLITEVMITLAVVIVNLTSHPLSNKSIVQFFKGKGKLSPFAAECLCLIVFLVICCIRIGLGRHFLMDASGLSALLSVILGAMGFLCAYIGAWFPDREFDLWDFRHPTTLRASASAKPSATAAPETGKTRTVAETTAKKAPVHPEKQVAPTLLEQFVTYMATKKPYLNPDLSITDVAFALRSNRTYISVLINENFEMNFRDYINEQRVEYSKQVMLKNPDEILEVIAEKCGFGSDSQFAKKFKDSEGISPKQWLAKQLSLK